MNELIKCRVRDDSVFEALRGLELHVVREKAFYKVVNITKDYSFGDDTWYSDIIRDFKIADSENPFLIGRHQLEFNRIPDSSDSIKTFESGAKRDSEGKEDYVETQSFLAMKRYAEYMTNNAKTYGRGNWRKGIPIDSYEQSFMRHMHKYFANKYDNANIEPNVDHLAAMRFNLDGIMHEEEKAKLDNK